jgi:lipid-A-disaccharide synthase
MAAAGVELLADLDDLAVMGLVEIARSLPRIIRLRRRVRRFLLEREVELLIPIDFPDFNLPLAAFARRHDIRVLYYIAPQVWAWRRRRAHRLAAATDRVCVVLPFEEQMLTGYGVDARFVGHPLLDDESAPSRSIEESGGKGTLGLFPGSRRQEVERILPVFLAAAEKIAGARPGTEIVVAREPDLPVGLYDRSPYPLLTAEEAIGKSRAALTKSGTITLQLALSGVPMLVGYRMHPLTYRIARRLVRVRHIGLVNLVADAPIVYELIQGDLTPEELATRVLPLLDPESSERHAMVRGLAEVRARLGQPGCASRVAHHALDLLEVA